MTSSWSEQEVALWLQEQGFGEFEDAFVSNNIDGRAIVNLSKEDLEDLGVKAIGKRLALVAAIVECFGKCAANKVEAAAAPAASASAWQAQPVQQQTVEADDGSHLAHERIKLFVGGLTDGISKEMLQQELQQFAPVDEVIVLMNPATGQSKGSGFAFVMGKKNAETLIACGSVEHSRRSAAAVPHRKHLQVDYATGELDRLRVLGPIDTKLFIGNLPREYQREHLEAMLKKFKPKEIHPIPVKEGNSKGSAFCIVSSMHVARQVITELDGQYTIPGFGSIAPVNVKVAESDQEKLLRKNGGGYGGPMSQFPPYQTQAHAGMAGMSAMGMDPYYMMQQQQQQQQPYGMPGSAMGYDHMQQYAAAAGGAYGGDPSHYSYPSNPMGMPAARVPGMGGGAAHAGPPGANVFVHNIPFSVDEAVLMQMFSRFGTIVSTRVVRDPTTQQSKGYGFVSFTQEQSALAACSVLDGQTIANRKIKVEIKDSGGRGRNASSGNRANPY